ncbi:protein-glutamate O-methyltransferase CheR [Rhizobium sp. SSA_523]|uniref:CheR family methyltransferase n=1 Tax=Rhizobium sp. SSA_523 TaxID=2952477 RepID=UPI0020911A8E|nr:CheR family methyltransferase [Rhizobium sp. SSA_523]MCO5734811.1 chemotaxis protein CheR [Rhizobium sp. SSA_523]WKC23458.1 CheR family methyltransferase [Rhizobium sp. SSA_523]
MTSNLAVSRQPVDDSLSRRNFDRLADYIYKYSGIKMPINKITMLEGRLRKRLRATQIASFDQYCTYLFDHDGLDSESVYLIDAVTTNKTDFFREPAHFDYLIGKALPDLLQSEPRHLRLWSSACSTGAEPFTLAMVMREALEARPDLTFTVTATDLSTEVLQTARRAIYPRDQMEPVPAALRRKYVMEPVDPRRGEVRIAPVLRRHVAFGRMNLMDKKYPVQDGQHVIFCRNVLIYFDKPTQLHVLSRLCECLLPGGYLFIGHSETAAGLNLPIRQVANTVFKRV